MCPGGMQSALKQSLDCPHAGHMQAALKQGTDSPLKHSLFRTPGCIAPGLVLTWLVESQGWVHDNLRQLISAAQLCSFHAD